MKNIDTLISELDEILKIYNSIEYHKLQSPLNSDVLHFYFNKLNIENKSFESLYKWKNGEKENEYCQMMQYGGLLSLEESIKLKENYLEGCVENIFIPIISDGEQILLFNNNRSKNYGRIYLYSVPLLYIEKPISCFDSLETMIITIVESYKEKAYIYDEKERWLNIDSEKIKLIAKKNNKKSAYWKEHDPLYWEDWYEI